MRAIDLEIRVLAAVDQIRAGKSVENDFIECKRGWPQENKVRQLAASLNRAGGDPVIYIIGIDEDTGEIFDVTGTEVSDWWNQITPKFDQMAPEMVRHMSVPLGEGQYVEAVAFASDRAPYVVKTGNANPSLEVPMREGTSTRTAKRDELLRLLIPATQIPEAIALEGYLQATYQPKVRRADANGRAHHQEEGLICRGQFRIFLAHNGRETVTLPTHGMSGTLWIGDEPYSAVVRPGVSENQPDPSAAPITTVDAITVTTSGAVVLGVSMKTLPPVKHEAFRAADSCRLEFDLEVLGAHRGLRLTIDMNRSKDRSFKTEFQEPIGKWSFQRERRS